MLGILRKAALAIGFGPILTVHIIYIKDPYLFFYFHATLREKSRPVIHISSCSLPSRKSSLALVFTFLLIRSSIVVVL